ncbi:MAG: histone deacetylase family protein, partial [Pseudomonadota bacterium]
MTLTVFSHSDCLEHSPPDGHPERPARLEAALRGIEQLSDFRMLDAQPVTREQLDRAHGADYLDRLSALNAEGQHLALDEDTHMGPGSLRAAALAAGAACQSVEAVMDPGLPDRA